MSVDEYWDLQQERKHLKTQFVKSWTSLEIDVVICPAFNTIAFPHEMGKDLTPMIGSYSMLYNLLDFPSGVVPVTRVNDVDVKSPREIVNFMDKFLRKSEENSLGMPVGLQVVALPFQDELCLSAMKLISSLLPDHILKY